MDVFVKFLVPFLFRELELRQVLRRYMSEQFHCRRESEQLSGIARKVGLFITGVFLSWQPWFRLWAVV